MIFCSVTLIWFTEPPSRRQGFYWAAYIASYVNLPMFIILLIDVVRRIIRDRKIARTLARWRDGNFDPA
jgi:hypothetical protein